MCCRDYARTETSLACIHGMVRSRRTNKKQMKMTPHYNPELTLSTTMAMTLSAKQRKQASLKSHRDQGNEP